ncbi:hypothetical protein [Actinoplanes sp. L3-i22]|uniref:hypothetical protein n=1 Tax=Actinoplanes sp. L3-i22 TaxID=2836373 RepID=UPI001C75A28A|nr:hypothetical protein [Actinoplanes sp. L3-i22]BCY09477.1 hypothetical protein L3i22_045650 [Actinoplanes sp. L3-i22]
MGFFSDLIRAWGVWLDGQSTSALTLAGWPMLLWARGGKLLQFAGGLIVLLDLADADKLRDRGEAAKERWRELRRSVSRIRKYRDSVEVADRLFDRLTVRVGRHGKAKFRYLREVRSPMELERAFDLGECQKLFDEIVAKVPTAHSHDAEIHGPEKRLCGDQILFIQREINRFLQYWMQPDQLRGRAETGGPRLIAELSGTVAFFIIVIPLAIWYTGDSDRVRATLIAAVTFAVAWRVFRRFDWLATLGLAVTAGIPIAAHRMVGFLFARKRPGHHLRWLAFIVFVVGFHFDLLAS